MTTLYLTQGIVGAGKSTWTREQCCRNPKVKMVSTDSLRWMLNGKYEYVEGLDDTINWGAVALANGLIAAGFDCIIDCCNLSVDRRTFWRTNIADADKYVAVVFPEKDKQWHIDRVMQSKKALGFDRKYWEDVYDLHVKQIETIKGDEFEVVKYEMVQ